MSSEIRQKQKKNKQTNKQTNKQKNRVLAIRFYASCRRDEFPHPLSEWPLNKKNKKQVQLANSMFDKRLHWLCKQHPWKEHTEFGDACIFRYAAIALINNLFIIYIINAACSGIKSDIP